MDEISDEKAQEIWRVRVIKELAKLRSEFQAGDKGALIVGLVYCAEYNLLMPAWVRNGVLALMMIEIEGQRSWDDVLGKPHSKGKHLRPKKSGDLKEMEVYNMVRYIIDNNKNVSIGEALFEAVGNELDMSMSQARNLYYKYKKSIEEDIRK